MKEVFTLYDPTEYVDLVPDKILKLENTKIFLVGCLIVTCCVAGYYIYKYYQLKDNED
jgi:hypothetical protein